MNICAVRLLTAFISPDMSPHEPTLMPSGQPLRYAIVDLAACLEDQQPQQPCAVCKHCGCVYVEG